MDGRHLERILTSTKKRFWPRDLKLPALHCHLADRKLSTYWSSERQCRAVLCCSIVRSPALDLRADRIATAKARGEVRESRYVTVRALQVLNSQTEEEKEKILLILNFRCGWKQEANKIQYKKTSLYRLGCRYTKVRNRKSWKLSCNRKLLN